MTFSFCDDWCLLFTHGWQQLPASPGPASLSACGDTPARDGGREKAA